MTYDNHPCSLQYSRRSYQFIFPEDIVLNEEREMEQNEAIGGTCILKAQASLEEVGRKIAEVASQLTPKDGDMNDDVIGDMVTNLAGAKETMASAIGAAKQGLGHYKTSKAAAFEVIERRPPTKSGKIPSMGQYSCSRCHFVTKNQDTLQEHMSTYHRSRPKKVRDKFHALT